MTDPTPEDLRALIGLFSVLLLFIAVDAKFRVDDRPPAAVDWVFVTVALFANAFGLLWCIASLAGIEAADLRVVWVAAFAAVISTIALAAVSVASRARTARRSDPHE